jgi:hypothetical protein
LRSYRDKKVVGVFVRFSCTASLDEMSISYGCSNEKKTILLNEIKLSDQQIKLGI